MPKVSKVNAKSPDGSPHRRKYWASGGLAYRKIRNLIRCGRMEPNRAYRVWERSRKRHYGVMPRAKLLRKLGVTEV